MFENFRLDLRFGPPLLKGHFTLPIGNAGGGLIKHAAGLKRAKQLARRMKVERQVGQIVETQPEAETKQEHQRDCQEPARREKRSIIPSYSHKAEILTLLD